MTPQDLQAIVRSVGMDAGLMEMGAASCIYSDGCEGVTMADFQKLADAIERHALASQAGPVDEAADDAATIQRLGGLLDQIARAVRGEPPAKTRWGYADLPDRVAAVVNSHALLASAIVAKHDTATANTAQAVPQWMPMESAPKVVGRLIGAVEGRARFICWGKASHVPMFGWILTDQGPEDCDLCEPTAWMPPPEPPLAASQNRGTEHE